MFKKNKEEKEAKNNKSAYILTRETMGMTLLLFSFLVLIMLFTGSAVFAGIGRAICTFMYGTFGYGSILAMLALSYLGFWLVFEKRIRFPFKPTLFFAAMLFCGFLLFHAASTRNMPIDSFGGYISECYNSAAQGFSGYTFGGVVSGCVVYPIAKLTKFIGAYIIFSLLTIGFGYLFVDSVMKHRKTNAVSDNINESADAETQASDTLTEDTAERIVDAVLDSEVEPVKVTPIADGRMAPSSVVAEEVKKEEAAPAQNDLGRKILFKKGEFDAESFKRNMIFNSDSYFSKPIDATKDYMSNFSSSAKKNTAVPESSYSESYQEEVASQQTSGPSSYVYGESPVDSLSGFEKAASGTFKTESRHDDISMGSSDGESERIVPIREEHRHIFEEPIEAVEVHDEIVEPDKSAERDIVERNVSESSSGFGQSARTSDRAVDFSEDIFSCDSERTAESDDSVGDDLNIFKIFGTRESSRKEESVRPDTSGLSSRRNESKADLFDNDDIEDDGIAPAVPKVEERREPTPPVRDTRNILRADKPAQPMRAEAPVSKPAESEPEKVEKPKHVWKKYIRPDLSLLDDYPEHNNVNTAEIEENKAIIVETLAKFKIASHISNVVIGPALTRYDVIIEDKTKSSQSVKYKEAIAMALKKDNVSAYLNFAQGALSIEVPNNTRTIVGLKSLLASPKFFNCKPDTITFALGKNLEGEVICPDITKMPHLLVAGTTGSGKSICLSALLISLLYKYSPEELRLILVDPKQVEFISYDKLPHLMINEIIFEAEKAIKALGWAIKEMERRYSLFKDMTTSGKATKNLEEYNANLPEGEEKLPKIVIILDEFGDLMLRAKKEIESKIIALAQKARACGIHLILATQRPSVDCITGLIKSNLPTRIGFKVNSFEDSRTIFDLAGAEKLLGKGDLYFRSSDSPDLARVQGCFVSSHEVQRVTDFVKAHNETYFDQSVSDYINTVEVTEQSAGSTSDDGAGENTETKIDETYYKALKYCIVANQASVSMIQRRFPVGYIKACKIIDWMETMNYITQSEGSKPRKVIITMEEFEATYGDVDD